MKYSKGKNVPTWLHRELNQYSKWRQHLLHPWVQGANKKFQGQIPCKKGCSACCCGVMAATLLDGMLIARDFITSRSLSRLDEAKDRAIKEQEFLVEQGFESTKPTAEMLVRCSSSWRAKEVPCLFLKGGACSIYLTRPSSCITHLVVGSEEQCDGEQDLSTVVDCSTQIRAVKEQEFAFLKGHREQLGLPPVVLGYMTICQACVVGANFILSPIEVLKSFGGKSG